MYAIHFIASTPAVKLFTFTVTESVLAELERMIVVYRATYAKHHFKSLEMLDFASIFQEKNI